MLKQCPLSAHGLSGTEDVTLIRGMVPARVDDYDLSMPRSFLLSAPLVLLLVVITPARADTLRCGGSLISTGALAGYVREKCGAPDSREEISEPIMARRPNGSTYQVGKTTKETWR